MLKISLQLLGEIKNESLFVGQGKSKNCFSEYLIEYWISGAMVEKYSYGNLVC